MFIRQMGITKGELFSANAGRLSIEFNEFITALGNARNKRIVNEANKFMIRKWIINGTFNVTN